MVMLNDLDRFHLVMDVIDRVPNLGERAAHLRQHMSDERLRHRAYTRAHGDDPPGLTNWTWPFDSGASHAPPEPSEPPSPGAEGSGEPGDHGAGT
jgi:xylulose-5-phosphate/fructose-6-phosphate phosphoketolase